MFDGVVGTLNNPEQRGSSDAIDDSYRHELRSRRSQMYRPGDHRSVPIAFGGANPSSWDSDGLSIRGQPLSRIDVVASSRAVVGLPHPRRCSRVPHQRKPKLNRDWRIGLFLWMESMTVRPRGFVRPLVERLYR